MAVSMLRKTTEAPTEIPKDRPALEYCSGREITSGLRVTNCVMLAERLSFTLPQLARSPENRHLVRCTSTGQIKPQTLIQHKSVMCDRLRAESRGEEFHSAFVGLHIT